MMKIRVFSHQEAERFEPPPKTPHAWISISTPGDEFPYIPNRKPWDLGIKRISFYNTDLTENIGPDIFVAREIYAFVFWLKLGIKELYIHCDDGVSRSAGVAAALSKIYNGTDEEFFRSPYDPDRLIYRLILEVHDKQGQGPGGDIAI